MAKQNHAMTEEQSYEITVDADDIIKALRYNGEDLAYGRSRTAEIEVRDGNATLHYHEQGNYYPAGHGPDHRIPANAFVCDVDWVRIEGTSYPTRSESRAHVKHEQGVEGWDDIDEEMVDEWHARAVEVWEDTVRYALQDEITISVNRGTDGYVDQVLSVNYSDGSDV